MSTQQDVSDTENMADQSLRSVLGALEQGLVVRLIMSKNIMDCTIYDEVGKILSDPSKRGYSQFPVRDKGKIVGILVRCESEAHPDAEVGHEMRGLSEGNLVAADMAISTYIEHETNQSFHLVVDNHGIAGIVTRSDLLKQPVRLHLFSLLSHLESAMVEYIKSRLPDEITWKGKLSPKRLCNAEKEQEEAKSKDQHLDLVYYLQWCDKRDIIRKLVKWQDRNLFEKDLKKLEQLRNSVVHANSYASEIDELGTAIKKARYWIERLASPCS